MGNGEKIFPAGVTWDGINEKDITQQERLK